jgi:hypothetical protein
MKVSELQAEVNEQLAEIRHKLRSKSPTWLIIAGIVVVIAVVLFITVFRNQDTKADEKIENLTREVEGLKRANAVYDSLLKIKDVEYKANRPTETRLKTKYEKIPESVRNLSNDELRRELTKYDY